MSAGQRIKETRIRFQKKQEELANILGIKRESLSAIERGATKPSLDAINRVAEVFLTSHKWLLTGEGEMFQKPEAENKSLRERLTERSKGYSETLCLLMDESREELLEYTDKELETKADKAELAETKNELRDLRNYVRHYHPLEKHTKRAVLPFQGLAAAAGPGLDADSYEGEISVKLPANISPSADMYVARISGTSMIEVIPNGGLALLKKPTSPPISGRIYVVEINGACTIKHLKMDDMGMRLVYLDGSGRAFSPDAGDTWRCMAQFISVVHE